MVPVELGLVLALDADVSALSPVEAALCTWTARTHRAPRPVIRRSPDVALSGDVAASQHEVMAALADGVRRRG